MHFPSDTMTAEERLRAIFNHEEPDRLPIYLMAVPAYSQTTREFRALGDDHCRAVLDHPAHAVRGDLAFLAEKPARFAFRHYLGAELQNYPVNLRPPPRARACVLDARRQLIEDEDRARAAWAQPEGQYVDALGQVFGWRVLPGGYRYSWYVDGFLKTKRAVLDWHAERGWPDEWAVEPIDARAFHTFQRAYRHTFYLVPQIGRMQLFESSWPIMGHARWAYYSRKDPAFIHQVIASRKRAQLKILAEIARVRPAIVMGGDDLGQKGRALVSPRWFEEFLAEPYREICGRVHAMGAKFFAHSCGNLEDLLPNVIAAGWDGWQSLEVAADVDHARVKRKYGDALVLVGGLDSTRELAFGTPATVERHVRAQIRAMSKGGGYVPGPAHDYLNVPLENALALRDAVYRWGGVGAEADHQCRRSSEKA